MHRYLPTSDRWGIAVRRATNFFFRFFGPIGAVVVVVTGTWGYLDCDTGLRLGDAFYKSVQFFALAYDNACDPPNGALGFARILAAFLLALAVVRLLFAHPWNRLKIWSQATFRAQNRHILIGHGALNEEIARDLAADGRPLTILARTFDQAAESFAAKYRIILVERDARDEQAFRGLLIHRAKKVVIACGDDSLTLELAQQVGSRIAGVHARNRTRKMRTKVIRTLENTAQKDAGSLSKAAAWMLGFFRLAAPEEMVFAHFTSTEMHHQLQMTREAGLERERQFTGFAIREETAKQFFARTWLAERAALADAAPGEKPRLHVVVVGGGDLGMAIAREAMMHGCCSRLGRPLITVIDRDRDGCRERFRSAMPHIFDTTIPEQDRPELVFLSARAEEVCTRHWPDDRDNPPDEAAEDVWQRDVAVTAWVICCTDDATNMALAMQLEREMLSGKRAPCPVYPRQWQGNVRAPGGTLIGQDDPVHLVAPFGGMQDVVPSLSFFDDRLPALARRIHAEYQVTTRENLEKSGLKDLMQKYGPPPWGEDAGLADPAQHAAFARAFDLERQKYKSDWAFLSDEGRLSNLSSAHHAALRLWELGFDWPGRYAGALPRLQNEYVSGIFTGEALSELGPDTRLGQVSEAEHRRWMVERALRGWSAARENERSNALRLHPDFRPYRDLFDAARAEKLRVDRYNKSKKLEGDNRRLLDETNLRRLDAAAVRGILTALCETDSDAQARPQRDHPPCDLFDLPELTGEIYRLTIRIPQVIAWDDEKRLALREAVNRIRAWMKKPTSLCMIVQAESPEIWTDFGFKKEFRKAVKAAAQTRDGIGPVQVIVTHQDVTGDRNSTARVEQRKQP